MPLSIADIRDAHKRLPSREVDTPDLGGAVKVRGLTLREVREVVALQEKKTQSIDVSKKVVEFAAVNDDGSPLFVGNDKAIIDDLSWNTIKAISEAAMELSGMTPAAGEAAEKN